MPFSRLLRTFSQPDLADPDLADARDSTSDDSNLPRGWHASGSKAIIHHRPWRARASTTDHTRPSQSNHVPPPRADTFPMPDHAPSRHLNSVAVPAIGAVPDELAESWITVKNGPKFADTSRALHAVGVSIAPLILFDNPLIQRLKMMCLL